MPDEPAPALTPADASRFAFDSSEDEWLERVRRVRREPESGRIGAYEVLGVAGEGGQGVVYRARQPGTGRAVALKRLLGGAWAGGASRERFAREIETDLALHHPNIVTVYGVETIEGQPHLEMEWIEGRPIDAWAAGQSRAPVLEVFLKVCAGVHHAHQRGVIHRDLKPSNILVDLAGEPRILDFGLARLTDPGLRTRVTRTGGFVGTLAYAAPEQVRADPEGADVRTDVYALGCVLYQCLTGRAPFDSGGDLAALTRAICETEPVRPSSLRAGVDPDLDAIVAMAMAKDKARRYPSVDALGADVRRVLAHEPVVARGPGAWYRFGKFARRRRALVAALAIVALSLVGASVASTLMYRRAERQRVIAAAVYEFMHQVLTPAERTPDVAWRDVLDNAAAHIDGAFPGQPLAEAEVHNMIQAMYARIGLYDRALPHAERWHAILEREHGPGHTETLKALNALAGVHYDSLNYAEAERLWRLVIDLRTRRLGAGHILVAETLGNLALVLSDTGRAAEAIPIHRRIVETYRRQEGPEHEHTLTVTNNLALALDYQGEHAESADLMRLVHDVRLRALGPDHHDTLGAAYNLVFPLLALDRIEEADGLAGDALDRARATLGEGDPLTIRLWWAIATAAERRDDAARAEGALRSALAGASGHLGQDNGLTIRAALKLGGFLTKTGRLDEAERVLQPALESCRRTLGADHRLTLEISGALQATRAPSAPVPP